MQNGRADFLNDNIGRLLWNFTFASVISGLVGTLYNIVDQIFIGRYVGFIGNAATNVVFPLITFSNAVAIMSGVGASAGFNLVLGRDSDNQSEAGKIVGSGVILMLGFGIILSLITLSMTEPLLKFFGATQENLPYALTYQKITACSLIFLILSVGGSAIIRADGSPNFALLSVSSGAVINILLDWLFMVSFKWGIAGAAWATFIGQSLSGLMTIYYIFCKFKSIPFKVSYLRFELEKIKLVCVLGMGPFVNHFSQTLVQILLNNALVIWGTVSVYGSEIPLACAGVAAKVSSITTAVVIGIAQGAQPIISFNYGAGRYLRARETGKLAVISVLSFSLAVFLCFQFLPREITLLFGSGNPEIYYEFAAKWFRIHFMFICVSGLQITVGNFFTALGKPLMSVLISVSRQVVAFPIFLYLLPRFWGLNGVIFSGAVSDGICAALAIIFFLSEWRKLASLNGDDTK